MADEAGNREAFRIQEFYCRNMDAPIYARLCAAIEVLRALPGKRLFQYRGEGGEVHVVRARDVNAFLQELAGCAISLKDFRTLCASATVLETLARAVPAGAARTRKKQVLEAVRSAAEELKNTPTICRKSYVHDAVVTAFEDGVLERFAWMDSTDWP